MRLQILHQAKAHKSNGRHHLCNTLCQKQRVVPSLTIVKPCHRQVSPSLSIAIVQPRHRQASPSLNLADIYRVHMWTDYRDRLLRLDVQMIVSACRDKRKSTLERISKIVAMTLYPICRLCWHGQGRWTLKRSPTNDSDVYARSKTSYSVPLTFNGCIENLCISPQGLAENLHARMSSNNEKGRYANIRETDVYVR